MDGVIPNTSMIRPGTVLEYSDGRPGHSGALAMVISVDGTGMLLQFEDRADDTRVRFNDPAWMDFLSIATTFRY